MSQERLAGEEIQTGTPVTGSSGPEAHADGPAGEADEKVCGTPGAVRILSRAQLVEFLCRLAGQVAGAAVTVGNITVALPEAVKVEFEYEEKDGKKELEIELKWGG